MLNTNSLSYRSARHFPRLRPTGKPRSQFHPLWCDVRDTPWMNMMRGQTATAALVGGRGIVRAWRFFPV